LYLSITLKSNQFITSVPVFKMVYWNDNTQTITSSTSSITLKSNQFITSVLVFKMIYWNDNTQTITSSTLLTLMAC